MTPGSLKDYQEKRDFKRTPEPAGRPGAGLRRAHFRHSEARRP